jgi:hypothetical protein
MFETAHSLFKASETISAAEATAEADRLSKARYSTGDVVTMGRFEWSVVRVFEYGTGELGYDLERSDLPGSCLPVHEWRVN